MGQALPSELQHPDTFPSSLAQALELGQQHQLIPIDVTFHHLERLWQIFQTNMLALSQYCPQRYSGSAFLIGADKSMAQADNNPSERASNATNLGWEQISWEQIIQGEFQQFTIPGDHFSLLREIDQITIIAHHLKSYISKS